MGYTMKGSPAKLGTIQGTAGHGSALKMARSPLRTDYKGKSKADVRASVLANNKGKDASDKSRKSMATEMKLWQIQNREIKRGPQTEAPKPEMRKKVVEEPKEKETGWAVKVGGLTAGTGSKYEKAIKE